jgi:tetratricopeptide (TPR) repeat protein
VKLALTPAWAEAAVLKHSSQVLMALAFLALTPGAAVHAASFHVTPEMQEACLDPDPAKANAACSAILNLGDIPDYERREALDGRATALIELGDSERARADAEALVRIAREPGDRARAEALLGQAFASGGKLEEATAALSDALKSDPDDTDSLALRGEILDKLHRDGEALRDLSAVVELRRNQANPYLDRGRFYFRRQKYRLAEDDFEHAVANAPTSALPHYWRGMARLRLQADEAAGADFDAAINLHKRFPAALVRRAELYEAVGDEPRAEDYFSLAAAGPDDDPESTKARAWLAARRPAKVSEPKPSPANVEQPVPAKVIPAPDAGGAGAPELKAATKAPDRSDKVDDGWITNLDAKLRKTRRN